MYMCYPADGMHTGTHFDSTAYIFKCMCVCVYAVSIMSEQVPTSTDTTACRPVDSEAVSSTADTAGRFI